MLHSHPYYTASSTTPREPIVRQLAPRPCPRCGTSDPPSIGPGKGPHSCTGVPDNQPATPAVPVPDPRVWLEHFPAQRRSPIANWVHYAVRGGAQTPAAVLQAVQATCARRLAWGDNADAALVREHLWSDPAGALGHGGPAPADRQKASELIEQLKAGRGQ
jgi:hypothetical protein